MIPPTEIDAVADRVESLLNGFDDDAARTKAQEVVRVLMELYGAGLANILNIVRDSGDSAEGLLERLGQDKLVASLLLVHQLHPVDAETRICRALLRVQKFLDTHRLIFEGLTEGTAKVRVQAENGNGPAAATLANAIEQAVRQSAPEVERVEISGVSQPAASLVQIGAAGA